MLTNKGQIERILIESCLPLDITQSLKDSLKDKKCSYVFLLNSDSVYTTKDPHEILVLIDAVINSKNMTVHNFDVYIDEDKNIESMKRIIDNYMQPTWWSRGATKLFNNYNRIVLNKLELKEARVEKALKEIDRLDKEQRNNTDI